MFTDKNPRYNSSDDAIQRLNDTIMMYQNKPVYMQASRGHDFVAYPIENGSTSKQINVNVRTIGYDQLHATIPLGFMNVEKDTQAYYLNRRPLRQTREGIDRRNLEVLSIGNRKFTDNILASQWWPTVYRTIVGEYPAVPRALELLSKSGDGSSCAFDRHFALHLKSTDEDPQIALYWKVMMIGFLHVHDGVFKGEPVRATLLPTYIKNPMLMDTLRRYNFIL